MKELENDWFELENIWYEEPLIDEDEEDEEDELEDGSDYDDYDDQDFDDNSQDGDDEDNRKRRNNDRDKDNSNNKPDSQSQEEKPGESQDTNPEDHINGPQEDTEVGKNGSDKRGKDSGTSDGKGDKSNADGKMTADGKPDGTDVKNAGKDRGKGASEGADKGSDKNAGKGKNADTLPEEGGPTHGSPNVGKGAEAPTTTGTQAGGTGAGTSSAGAAGAAGTEAGASAAGAGAAEGGALAAEGAGGAAATAGSGAAAGASAGAAGASGAAAGGAAAGGVLAAAWPVVVIILIIVAIIIIVTGFVMFFLTIPGMILGQIKSFSVGIYDGIMDMLIGSENNVKMSEVIEVADYIENMGYDLHGAGFLTDQIEGGSGSFHGKYTGETIHYKWANFWDEGARELDPDENIYADKTGVLRDTQGIVYVHSNYITKYIISDNYVYLIKNNNHNFKKAIKDIGESGFIGFLGNFANNSWGTGLLYFFKESSFGVPGSPYGDGWDTFSKVASKITGGLAGSDISLEIDRKAQELVITTKAGWLKSLFGAVDHSFRYNLEGWTGRYGMPLEFLLSVHLTSMQPGLASDLADNFETEVQILMHEILVDIEGGAKVDGEGSVMTEEKLREKAQEARDAKAQRDQEWELHQQEQDFERQQAQDRGEEVPPIPTQEEQDAEREAFYADVGDPDKYDSYADDASKLDAGGIKSYIPYIYQVVDHWFRDVYFCTGENASDIIINDEEYEATTGERWTDYEVDEVLDEKYTKGRLGNVQYKLYTFDYAADGTVIGETPYNGTIEQAEKEGVKVHKKAKTESIYNAKDWTDSTGAWTAYELGEGSEGSWQQYDGEDLGFNNPQEDIYYKMSTSESIKQVGDGQRGPTNATIKKMFTWNKYYTYNGTEERAKAIDEDRYSGAVKAAMDSYESGKAGKASSSINNAGKDPRDPSLIETFSVDKNSLAAFDILTNMETLDSDAIYRDFKELIVELNFFDKEELTNIPTKTFEWPIAEAGSAGWPVRKFEKKENEWGTLIHSKLDLTYLKEVESLKIKKLFENFDNSSEGETGTLLINNDIVVENNINIQSSEVVAQIPSVKTMIQGLPTNKLTARGQSSRTSQYRKSTFLETSQACWEYIVDAGRYSYAGASIPVDQGSTVDCSSFVSWCIYEYGYDDFGGAQHCTGTLVEEAKSGVYDKYGWEIIDVAAGENVLSKLQPGDILVRDDGAGTGAHGHTQVIKEVQGGTTIVYDCGAESHWVKENREGDTSNFFADDRPGVIIRIEGVTKEEPKPYEGYEAGQLVVSPVTGVVIDAGMTRKDSSKEKLNLDTELNENVGYIKIRVLDDQDYKAIFGNADAESLADDLKGYAYFLEEYKRANVSGNVMYIEGFNLELLKNKNTFGSDLSNISEDGEITNMYTERKYDDVLSKEAREKLEDREEAMVDAKPYYETSAGILIKEGTALGTCYGDGDGAKEKFTAFYNEKKEEYKTKDMDDKNPFEEEEKESEESDEEKPWKDRNITQRPGMVPNNNSDKVTDEIMKEEGNGNNIRIIMRTSQDGTDATTEKDSVVEDVEDYIETDTIERSNEWEIVIPEEFGNGGYTVTCYGPAGWYYMDGTTKAVAAGTGQERVHNAWVAAGCKYEDGIATLDGKYLIACTTTFGQAGDNVLFKLDNGIVLDCIIADIKNQDDPGCNEWGHNDGQNVIEFEVDINVFRERGNPGSASWHPEWQSGVHLAHNAGQYV
ncbi:MAG: CHAP domain-containing protein [Clostridia bacterium]|nr:CHAP domain-containing protein [Clostridia bacterium]